MRPLLLLAGLFAAAPALAADHELSAEFGSLVVGDSAWSTFNDDGAAFSFGFRGAYAFHEHFAVMADWHHVRTGNTLMLEIGDPERVGYSAYFGNEVALGLRFDWTFWDLLVPYAHVDGLAFFGQARFDDDNLDPESPGQVKESAVSGGFRPMGGLEVRIPRKHGRGLTAALHVEAGYTWLSTAHYDTFGDMALRGFTFRTGLGLRL